MKLHQVRVVYSDSLSTNINPGATLKELSRVKDLSDGDCLLIEGLSLSDALWLARAIRLGLCFIGRTALAPIVITAAPETPGESVGDFLGLGADESPSARTERISPALEVVVHTPGIYLAENREEAAAVADGAAFLDAGDFEAFMDMTKITGQHGSHAIANEWAAYTLGRLLKLPGSDSIPATRDLVYLCYLLLSGMSKEDRAELCGGENRAAEKCRSKIKRTGTSGKKILLVDDQDDVWAPVVRELVGQNNRLTVWGKADIARADGEILLRGMRPGEWSREIADSFDLVLLDMRLFEERVSNPGNELSGLQALKAIMDLNRGQRVIMFTSSNKVWNIKRSLELGAADIFIKESPQYPMKEEARMKALQNLIDGISEALDHDWLKDVYAMGAATVAEAERRAELEDPYDEDGGVRIDLYLDIADQTRSALEIFMNAGNDPKKIQLAYFQLYYVFEQCMQYFKTVEGRSTAQLDDLRTLFGLDRTADSYLCAALTPLRLMRNRLAHSEQRDYEEFYIETDFQRKNWILGEKSSGTPVRHLFGASDPNAFRALMYTVSRLVARDLMI